MKIEFNLNKPSKILRTILHGMNKDKTKLSVKLMSFLMNNVLATNSLLDQLNKTEKHLMLLEHSNKMLMDTFLMEMPLN